MVLSGMNEPAQLQDNLDTANQSMPDMLTKKEMDVINQVIDIYNASYKVPCTGCNYCMPCPKGINIPACFSAYNASYAIGRITGIQQYMLSTGVMSKTPHQVSDCVACGKCAKQCPQHIPIPEALKDVQKRMEPLWYRAATSVVRAVNK